MAFGIYAAEGIHSSVRHRLIEGCGTVFILFVTVFAVYIGEQFAVKVSLERVYKFITSEFIIACFRSFVNYNVVGEEYFDIRPVLVAYAEARGSPQIELSAVADVYGRQTYEIEHGVAFLRCGCFYVCGISVNRSVEEEAVARTVGYSVAERSVG